MRSSGLIVAGVTALYGMVGLVATGPPGYAAAAPPGAAVTGPERLAPKGCDNEPPQAGVHGGLVPAQEEFDTDSVWPISDGAGVTVAVLDSGVDVSHPQLSGADIGDGADFLHGKGGGSGRRDCDGRGTAAVSLIAAQQVEGVMFQGLAYRAKVLPVVVTEAAGHSGDDRQTVSPETLARAINWAVGQHVDVIDVSVAVYEDVPELQQAVEHAVTNDVVVVAAVGDRAGKGDPAKGTRPDPGPVPYPGSYDGVVGVAGVDGSGQHLATSQYGDYVKLAAPGEAVAANRGKGHVVVSGTGIAAAFVSATAALVRSRWPQMRADEVTRRLLATASLAAASRAKAGRGIVNPYGALTEGLSDDEPAAPAGMVPHSAEPAELARAEEWRFSGDLALTMAAVGVLLAGGMLATLSLLPLGRRRRWRPGRAQPFPEPEADEVPPAPVKLFEDLEAD